MVNINSSIIAAHLARKQEQLQAQTGIKVAPVPHDESCLCEDCLRHEFREQCRTDVCHICLKPRHHPYHLPRKP